MAIVCVIVIYVVCGFCVTFWDFVCVRLGGWVGDFWFPAWWVCAVCGLSVCVVV